MPFKPNQNVPSGSEGTWIRRFARLVRDLDTEAFTQSLIEIVRSIAPVESLVILLFRRNAPPIVLHDAMNQKEHDIFYERYLCGGYILSPFYRTWRDHELSGFFQMKEVVPEDFETTEVYRSYYLHTGLADEGAYLEPLDNESAVFVWLGICARMFSAQEIYDYRTIEPLLSVCSTRHWHRMKDLAAGSADPGRLLHRRLEEALENFGKSVLSDREAEVVHLLLRGYSTKLAADKLKIAPGTVKNHRNSIYLKLDITSLSELFSLFMQSFSESGPSQRGDPLVHYLARMSQSHPATGRESI